MIISIIVLIVIVYIMLLIIRNYTTEINDVPPPKKQIKSNKITIKDIDHIIEDKVNKAVWKRSKEIEKIYKKYNK